MPRRLPIFYSALLLTAVNLLLRFAGTSFQVYISNRIGAAGVGLLQLVMSTGGFAMVAGMAGIRTATMYLTAEELGNPRPGNTKTVLSACILYSIVCSGVSAAALYALAPRIARDWIGDLRTVDALRLYGAFLPCSCLCGVMTGYFTAANRIGTLAIVEVMEQVFSMGVTMVTLIHWAGEDPGRACLCVILGSGAGACLTLVTLCLLRFPEKPPSGSAVSVGHRLYSVAVPLALADMLKSGINTVENLMVPKRLALHGPTKNALAAFGCVSGMVFPVLMFPACILFALAELLIPELARCMAAESRVRIRYLSEKSLRITLLYATFLFGLLFLIAPELCLKLYGSTEAEDHLRRYSLLIPMLYCDAIVDAMTKGLGQQKICVRYNILTSGMDVLFLYLLLPKYGMTGYFISFFITHLINFLLSLRRLIRITGQPFPFCTQAVTAAAALISLRGASGFADPLLRCVVYCAALSSLLYLLKIIRKDDAAWILRLIRNTQNSRAD